MALILNIESSTKNCSVALGKDGEILAFRSILEEKYSHSEKLAPFIKEMMEEEKLAFEDLEAISISGGPGSYTGLRIGTSTAKGLCFALDIPLIGVPTLEVLANHGEIPQVENSLLFPMIDARRMEVFTGVFNEKKEWMRETDAVVIESEFLDPFSDFPCLLFGDGALKTRDLLGHNSNLRYLSDLHPDARYMVELSEQRFLENKFEDLAYYEPFYLKDFIAGKPKKLL